MAAHYDLVVRGGLVADGSGGELFEADVAVSDGKIAAVGQGLGNGAEEIDAKGRLLTPGFVDIHTHYDGQITWDDRLAPSANHGVTTVLMGNCGVGFAPCRPQDRARLIKVMEGVEDIPQVVMAEGIPWNWESFPEYLDVLAGRRADLDFAAQAPHAPIRVNVMGERGANREPATDEELARMTSLVAEAVRAGAFGVTTSRSVYHRDADGAIAPMVMAEERELLALAGGLRAAGSGVFQLLPGAQEGRDPTDEMALLRRVVRAAGGRPLSFSLLDSAQFPDHLQLTLDLLALARAEGEPIRAQVLPRAVGVLLGLDLSFHPFRFRASYRAIEYLPLASRVAAMRDPGLRARLLSERPEHPNEVYLYFSSQAAALFPLGDPPNYEPRAEDSVGARAARLGVTPDELAYDLMLEHDGRAVFLLPSSNFVGGTLDRVHQMLAHEGALLGLGDGGAHYGTICDSSYSTFALTYWTRDRSVGRKIGVPAMIRALSRANALAVGLDDRGLIAPGLIGDLNIIDYDRLRLRAPRMVHDLPASGGRLMQVAEGFEATIKSGVATYREGEPTGALPGRLVRNRPALQAAQ